MKDEQGKSLYADAIKYLLNDSEALYYYINGRRNQAKELMRKFINCIWKII